MRVVVIGAGISGCVCAWRLAQKGHSVTLAEKGRGVGGRMATRRMEGARIDHGAQFFTTRDPRMQSLVSLWEQEGMVVPWYDRVPGRDDLSGRVRFRGVDGITAPAKYLAKSFDVETEFFVSQIKRNHGVWNVSKKDGNQFECEHLVITMPSVQILELFERSDYQLDPDTMKRLSAIRHTRCLAVLGILDQKSSLSVPGTITHPVAEIDWLSDNQVKEFLLFLPVQFMPRMITARSTGIHWMKTEYRI